MDVQFHIALNIKTAEGPESFGKFFVGSDRQKAKAIFRRLQGMEHIQEENVLFLELVETRNGLPFNLEMITCTLEQVAENCRIITKELFKTYAL